MSSIIDGLLYCWKKNLEYGPNLVKDLSDEQMTRQPAPASSAPANHPAWVFSHLNVYIPIVGCLITGEEIVDPKDHKFGMTSKPEADRTIYATKQELIDEFVSGHEKVIEQLSKADDSIFDRDVQLERWRERMPKVGTALPYLMILHENVHLGQLSAWRRVQGLPSV